LRFFEKTMAESVLRRGKRSKQADARSGAHGKDQPGDLFDMAEHLVSMRQLALFRMSA